jgi:hypothetical protein
MGVEPASSPRRRLARASHATMRPAAWRQRPGRRLAPSGSRGATRGPNAASRVAFWLLLALGCFAQKPSSENAPSRAPAPAHPPPESPSLPPPTLEEQRETPSLPRAAPESNAESGAGSGALAPAPPPPALGSDPKPAKRRAPAASAAPGEADRQRSERTLDDADGQRALELRERLNRSFRAGTPDCPSARDRKKAVCDLADQICQLIDRDPNVASVAEYCADAKERCAEAARRTSQRCPE